MTDIGITQLATTKLWCFNIIEALPDYWMLI
jgi:hypothetical protein